jgi:hypothetical protein
MRGHQRVVDARAVDQPRNGRCGLTFRQARDPQVEGWRAFPVEAHGLLRRRIARGVNHMRQPRGVQEGRGGFPSVELAQLPEKQVRTTARDAMKAGPSGGDSCPILALAPKLERPRMVVRIEHDGVIGRGREREVH